MGVKVTNAGAKLVHLSFELCWDSEKGREEGEVGDAGGLQKEGWLDWCWDGSRDRENGQVDMGGMLVFLGCADFVLSFFVRCETRLRTEE